MTNSTATILTVWTGVLICGLFDANILQAKECVRHNGAKIALQMVRGNKSYSKATLRVFAAVDSRNHRKLDAILNSKQELSRAQYNGNSVLHAAIENDDYQSASVLLNHGADPNLRDRVGFSPLAYAVEYSDLKMIRLLVNHGGKIDWENGHGHTNLLSVALYRRYCPPLDEQAILYLLEKGVSTKHIDRVMFKRLMNRDFVRTMELLLKNKLDLKNRIYSDAYALARSESMRSLLLKFGARPYVRSNDVPTPLSRLVFSRDADGILRLLDNGYDLSQERPDILVHVIQQGLPFDVFRSLVEKGIDINHKLQVDQNYLIHVAARGRSTKICAYLLHENPGFLEAQDISGQRPLHVAAEAGNLETVKLLVERGAKIDAVDKRGETPLFLARYNIAKYLIEHGANINHLDGYNRTLLFRAIKNRDQQLVKRVIRMGTDVNQQDTLGNTPLMYAAYYGQTDAVNLLVNSNNIDLNARNQIGETALIIAAGKGYTSIVSSLLKHKANTQIGTHIAGRRFRVKVKYDGKIVWRAHGNPYGINLEPGEPEFISNGSQPRNLSPAPKLTRVMTDSKGGRVIVLSPGNNYAVAAGGPRITSAGVQVIAGSRYKDDTALSRAKRHGNADIVSLLEGREK